MSDSVAAAPVNPSPPRPISAAAARRALASLRQTEAAVTNVTAAVATTAGAPSPGLGTVVDVSV